jgi:hypothetical protein
VLFCAVANGNKHACEVVAESISAVQIYAPVCSLDTLTTYGNECLAKCANDDANLVPGKCEEHQECCPDPDFCCGYDCLPIEEVTPPCVPVRTERHTLSASPYPLSSPLNPYPVHQPLYGAHVNCLRGTTRFPRNVQLYSVALQSTRAQIANRMKCKE